MSASSKLACVIAAGGTAGHVRPALAVGEALRARGLTVTFAGTPDRVESRLVPEAGFALDTFPVSGLPAQAERRPAPRRLARVGGTRSLPADPRPAPARRRARRRRLRRRADGARRAAARDPRGADRGGRPPRAREPARRAVRAAAVPRLRDPRAATARRYAVVGRPIPVAHRGASREEGRARFELPPDGPVVAVFGALAGARSLNEMAVAAWGAGGPAVLHVCGERDYDSLRAAGRPSRVRAARPDRPLRRGARRGRPRRLARRGNGLGARRGGDAGDPRPVPLRDRRPPDAQRPPLRARGRRGRRPGRGGRPGSRARRPSCSRDTGAARGDARGDARARAPRRGRRDRRRARRPRRGAGGDARGESTTSPLEGRRLYFVGIGGSGLSAYANVARALGRRGARLGRAGDDLHGDARRDRGRPRRRAAACPTGWRSIVSTAHLARCEGTPRAAFLAELVAAQPVDRRRPGPTGRRRRPR